MATNDLTQLVRDYLESSGLKILFQDEACVVADKLVFGTDRDTWIVWTLPPDQEAGRYESTIRAKIGNQGKNYPDAKKYLLSKTRAGFSRDFQQMLSEENIKWLVPVWFFDTAFKVEEAPRAVSAVSDIRSLDFLKKRVPQPYYFDQVSGDSLKGPDLFDTLATELSRSELPTVHIIVGRAGIGKSYLFRALFAHLYDKFLKAKNGQRDFPRPIPLMPEHMKGTFALRTELIVENFLRTDVASPVGRETFEWLLTNGFATWLLDGLDELYSGDPHFFEYLEHLVTQENSKAQIAIWCRDSLLTTSDPFAEFRELCGQSTMLKIYKLSEWERQSKRSYAWLSIEGRFPSPDESDIPQVTSFMQQIDYSPTLKSISGLPFYCYLLLELFKQDRLHEFPDDVTMLTHVVEQMIKREIDKGLIDLRLLLPNGLEDWLEQIAVNYIEGRKYSDIDRDESLDYGRLVILDGVDAKSQSHLLVSLLQFPLFTAGDQSGRIGFSHDLIAETLAANGYLKRIRRDPVDVANRLAHVDLEMPTLLRFIASKIASTEEQAILNSLRYGDFRGKSFTVLLSIIMLARPERDLIKRTSANFEARDLSAIQFVKRDLSDLSFRNSDLSGARFVECDLRRTKFEGAFFNRTRFDGNNQLEDARIVDVARIQSVFVGGRLIDDPNKIRDWIASSTGRAQPTGEPCATALQVQAIFRKFISPLGDPKRDELRYDALCAGKHWNSAPPTEECVDELKRAGYLDGPDVRHRYRRASGDKYADTVKFVRDDNISDGLGRVIARLCRQKGCLHQTK